MGRSVHEERAPPALSGLSRRHMLAITGVPVLAAACSSWPMSRPAATLGQRAAQKGLDFGFAVTAAQIAAGSASGPIAASQSTMIATGNEMKWRVVEASPGKLNFTGAQAIADFAAHNRLALRGHTALWYRSTPDWVRPLLEGPAAIDVMTKHVGDLVAKWRGQVVEWDVVNEAIEPRDGLPWGLRRTPFGRAVGLDWIDQSFRAARSADPTARLYYNEYGIETALPGESEKRQAVLNLLRELKRRGTPVDGLGIQSHLAVIRPFDEEEFHRFLAEVGALGLRVRLTEFDVSDHKLVGPRSITDNQVAHYARRYLDAAFDARCVSGLICWGVRNGESWLQSQAWARPKGGAELRPLPYDTDGKPTPLWDAIAAALGAASGR